MSPELFLMTLLIIKHFICDFPLQSIWMASNKGTYGHIGGLSHAWTHMMGTFVCFIIIGQSIEVFITPLPFAQVMVAEGIIHYHTDWFKMWLNKKMNWTCDKSRAFWQSLGIDQMVHYLTYVGMVWYLIL